MDDYETNRRRSIEQARACRKGLPDSQLVPGAVVTHSANKHTGDRGGVSAIWKILATNAGHVALECVRGDPYRKIGYRTSQLVSEYEWYAAEHLLAEIERDEDPDAQKLGPHLLESERGGRQKGRSS